MANLTRAQLTAAVRLLIGIGILLLMLAFLRACLSPPPLPAPRMPAGTDTQATDSNGSLYPPRY